MRTVKPEARLLGVDDAPFDFEDETTELVGTVFRGGAYLEGVLMEEVTVDGLDASDTIVAMIQESRHDQQVQAVLLDGITVAGFNVVDLQQVADDTGIGVIAVSRNEPGEAAMDGGLENVDRRADREELIDAAGTAKEHGTGDGTVYFQHAGIDEETVRNVLDVATVRGVVPEPVRVAHMIAGAVATGASTGRA
ncbi:MAG: DUF99 family protein [Candidatus Nanohaloarchaea archaeon]|nr:DUF99 family protein [Candidatus Nanohaloarchaea archaeon]